MRLAIVAVLLSALIIGLGFTNSREAPTFITAPVERGSISTVVKATGTTEAVLTVDVSSQLSGRIAAVFVDFNDSVKAGQPIAQLDQEIFAARVNEARAALSVARAAASVQKAALERAEVSISNTQTAKKMAEAQSAALKARQDELERDLARKLALERSGSVAERDVSQLRAQREAGAADLRAATVQVQMKEEAIAIAQAEQRMAEANLENALAVVEQKQAALDQARLDLERTVLRAPINGVIIKRDVNPGQTVAVSLEAKTLFKIANDLGEMEVHGKIDEADIGRIKLGQRARFTVDAYPDRTFVGRVQQIRKSPEVVQNVVTYTTIVSAPNPDLLLLPGMTAQLQVTINDTGEIVKIPNQSLRFRPANANSAGTTDAALATPSSDGRTTVWVAGTDGRAVPILVRLGASDDTSTEVLEGALAEGQPLIVGISNSQDQKRFLGIRLGSVHAVTDVSLAIEQGEFVAITGRSGSGKSTLMSMLGLLEQPDAGACIFKGHDVRLLSEDTRAMLRGRDIGFVFQIPALLPRSSALENVELPLVYAGIRWAERRRRAAAALARVGLAHRGQHWPNQLSGGEQQRVVIARATVTNPALILADEPTGALDSRTSEGILALFEDFHRDGRTIVVVTHASDVADRAQRRIMLSDGRVVSDDASRSKNLHLRNVSSAIGK